MTTTNIAEIPGEAVQVNAATYLSIPKTERIKDQLVLKLTDHCYRPKLEDLASDWVAHVAVPGFKAYRQQRGGAEIDSFCSIGTGPGLDVLSAVEILGATRVGLTDVHEEVVATAVDNVARNRNERYPLTIESGYGDLLAPLLRHASPYAVIYENLPNVRLQTQEEVAAERNSSTYAPPRTEYLPELIKQQMLDLHYLALVQAKDLLLPGGALLACIGARVPLHVLVSLGELAGYRSSVLTYSWKLQEAAETLVPGYDESQKNGFGPFYFYRPEALRRAFAGVALAESGKHAVEIERSLLPHRLDSAAAHAAVKNGEPIGHTVAFLKSELR